MQKLFENWREFRKNTLSEQETRLKTTATKAGVIDFKLHAKMKKSLEWLKRETGNNDITLAQALGPCVGGPCAQSSSPDGGVNFRHVNSAVPRAYIDYQTGKTVHDKWHNKPSKAVPTGIEPHMTQSVDTGSTDVYQKEELPDDILSYEDISNKLNICFE